MGYGLCLKVLHDYLPFLSSFCPATAVTHNDQYRLWQEGALASPGVQDFAELGVTVELLKGAKEARKTRSVASMYRTSGIPTGVGHSSTELLLHPRNPLVHPYWEITRDTDNA